MHHVIESLFLASVRSIQMRSEVSIHTDAFVKKDVHVLPVLKIGPGTRNLSSESERMFPSGSIAFGGVLCLLYPGVVIVGMSLHGEITIHERNIHTCISLTSTHCLASIQKILTAPWYSCKVRAMEVSFQKVVMPIIPRRWDVSAPNPEKLRKNFLLLFQ